MFSCIPSFFREYLLNNKINIVKKEVEIFRWGFFGEKSKILLNISFKNIDSIKIQIKGGLNPTRVIFLKLTNMSEIPLTSSQTILSISEIEKKATRLSEILQVPIEGLY